MRNLFSSKMIITTVVLLGLFLAAGCSALTEARQAEDPQEKVVPEAPSEQVQVILHFADWQAQHVIPERRQVEVTDDSELPKAVVEHLLQGPKDPHLLRTFPDDVQLLSVEVEGSLAYINFSSEVEAIAGRAGQTMAMQSLVSSLVELEAIDRVQPLVEGKKSLTFEGHGTIDEPLQPSDIATFPIFVDEDRAEWLQQRADEGIETFRTDPLQAARFDGRMVGLTAEDELELIDEAQGRAEVLVRRNGREYVMEMIQPAREGEGGIWLISSIEEK